MQTRPKAEGSALSASPPLRRSVETPDDLQSVRVAPFQHGQHHGSQMATQFVAADRVHAIILDSLSILSRDEISLGNGRYARVQGGAVM